MYIKNIKFLIKNGLHIRPIVKIIKISNKFNSKTYILNKNKIANSKNLFQLQKLDINFGDIITIISFGNDELLVVKFLINFINKKIR